MVTFNYVKTDGLVIRTAWDENHTGPIELLVTLDPDAYQDGKGISKRTIHNLSFASQTPDTMKTFGNLQAEGDWLEANKPAFRNRPEDPDTFYAHVALFFVLAVQDEAKGVTEALASHAAVRPSMARLWIASARSRGMLTNNDTKRYAGRAYGVLTDKARTILGSQSYSHAA